MGRKTPATIISHYGQGPEMSTIIELVAHKIPVCREVGMLQHSFKLKALPSFGRLCKAERLHYGFWRIHILLRREGFMDNLKRMYTGLFVRKD
ncbi:hypothetical protein [Ulvibacterium sp.]|uniref:hypothetical protein n=1 Tax=Ulvibacterium sp. TaxID=2665914 RepID=UPI0026351CDF|nr:hypothetical protein [Ulvibacterium sp.]